MATAVPISGTTTRINRVFNDSNVIFHLQLGEERDVVLTLADKGVLAEDAEDVLVNVNMVDNEKYLKVTTNDMLI